MPLQETSQRRKSTPLREIFMLLQAKQSQKPDEWRQMSLFNFGLFRFCEIETAKKVKTCFQGK
jgi:hypothetical protein